jgi:Histidine kinase-like ATPase domain
MTTPSPKLALATAAEWSWLDSAVRMAWLCWHSGAPLNRQPGSVPADPAPLVPRVVTGTPAPAAYSIGPARTFVIQTMHSWGEAGRAGDVAAVVSELLANALRHALPAASAIGELLPSPIRLGLQHAGPYVVCAVADPSSESPVLRQPDWQDESGRGLLLVASLSDRWGHCLASGAAGKVVWAAFASVAGR